MDASVGSISTKPASDCVQAHANRRQVARLHVTCSLAAVCMKYEAICTYTKRYKNLAVKKICSQLPEVMPCDVLNFPIP